MLQEMLKTAASFIPYGKQEITQDDIAAVCDALKSDWLTTGPCVEKFERAFARAVSVKEAVAVSSGTAALHAVTHALGIGPGDEVLIPAMTFAATANCVVFQGGTPVFVDVDPATLLVDPECVRQKITPKTKAIIAVDYAGQPCDYDRLREIAKGHGLALVADACHSLGARYKEKAVGGLADLNVFSFHPVKQITTGEGGMITTNNPEFAQRMRRFRNHGINSDPRKRQDQGTWFYEMVELGYNYRITDFQCALGIAQLERLDGLIRKRQRIAACYNSAFSSLKGLKPLSALSNRSHAYHLYVVRLERASLKADRDQIFAALRQEAIGVNVHYIPVHFHPFYRQRFGLKPGLCPVAERAYEEIITLPMFPGMTDEEVERVIAVVVKVIEEAKR